MRPAHAQSVGRLLFLNEESNNGGNLLGGVDEQGTFHVFGSGTQPGLAHQVITAVTGSGILCYDSINGGGSFVQLDGTGLPRFNTGIGLSAGWYTVTALGNHLFFYDAKHTGAIVAVNPDGSTTQTQTVTNLSPWTDIPATDNYLVFYNRTNGALATAAISNIERLAQTSTGSTIVNATLFASVGDDLMMYDPGTGNYAILQILYNGSRTDAVSAAATGVLPKGFNAVLRHDRALLFYNGESGASLIGTLSQSGPGLASWKKTQSLKLLAGWTSMTSAGQFLVFYNQLSGALSVGYINDAGKWTQTDYEANIGLGYNAVGATAR